MTSASERRLATILAADVVGYSRLLEADEKGTHERVRALQGADRAANPCASRPHRQAHGQRRAGGRSV
jgi:class 3 adenylate cyclase